MTVCPSCAAENIPGDDHCSKCGQPLCDLHLPMPESAVERSLLTERVSVLKPNKPVTVEADTPVGEVLRMLVNENIGSLIVVQNDEPTGIFSERDALMKLNVEAAALSERPVREFMTPAPETLVESAKLVFALQRMDVGGYRHLPIVDDDGKLTGIVSVRDILRYLASALTAAATSDS